ncbi:isoflavone reductase [Histoplasma ohiense]|nr:isoflavone reductase [Histoplasma ohiense (nom. inval.)]
MESKSQKEVFEKTNIMDGSGSDRAPKNVQFGATKPDYQLSDQFYSATVQGFPAKCVSLSVYELGLLLTPLLCHTRNYELRASFISVYLHQLFFFHTSSTTILLARSKHKFPTLLGFRTQKIKDRFQNYQSFRFISLLLRRFPSSLAPGTPSRS